jgi:hypothetical protein
LIIGPPSVTEELLSETVIVDPEIAPENWLGLNISSLVGEDRTTPIVTAKEDDPPLLLLLPPDVLTMHVPDFALENVTVADVEVMIFNVSHSMYCGVAASSKHWTMMLVVLALCSRATEVAAVNDLE